MLKSNRIKLETLDEIAIVRLNLPHDEPPQTPTPAEQLAYACNSLNEDSAIRAVILTNTPNVILSEAKNLAENINSFWHKTPNPFPQSTPDEDPESALKRQRVASQVANLKAPTIAAIHGLAWNQGLEIALACDLRLADEDSTFGFSSLAEGFIPWDGGTQRLPRIIGRAHALDLLLTGRSLSAPEALEIGLINAIAPAKDLESASLNLARTIASAAPIAVRYLKEAVHKGLDLSLPQGLNLEADLSFILQTTQDRQRGIDSFLNKTTPKFTAQ